MTKQQCQEYKDYYDRRKERDCKIAQTNYDLGRKRLLEKIEKEITTLMRNPSTEDDYILKILNQLKQ